VSYLLTGQAKKYITLTTMPLILRHTFKADSLDANRRVVTVTFIYACLEDSGSNNAVATILIIKGWILQIWQKVEKGEFHKFSVFASNYNTY